MAPNSNIFFERWLRATLIANPWLVANLGKDSQGNPAVYPQHYQNPDERVGYPHLAIGRFGSTASIDRFQHLPFLALQMDGLRFSLCAYSTSSVDEADKVYSRAQTIIQGPNAVPATTDDFGAYQITRTLYRNDLYDTATKAYHVHTEYRVWIQKGVQSLA